MKTLPRTILHLLGPAFFGGLQAMIYAWWSSATPLELSSLVLGPVLFFFPALILCGIPSIFYMIAMETIYRNGFAERCKTAIAISTFLGLLSGAAIGLTGVILGNRLYPDGLFFCVIGANTGLVISTIIYLSGAKEDSEKRAKMRIGPYKRPSQRSLTKH